MNTQDISALTVWQLARPGALWVTVTACMLGFASAAACGVDPDWAGALATLLLATSFHAAANMLQENDTAPASTPALAPAALASFTGGLGLVQQGKVNLREVHQVAWAVLALTLLAGTLLALKTGGGLMLLGLAGLVLVWTYASPPWRLASHGLGEVLTALAWWLVVLGADYVWRRHFFLIPAVNAASFALLMANLHLASSFATAEADRAAARHSLRVRLGLRWAAALYWLLLTLAYVWLAGGVLALYQPTPALWALVSVPFSVLAGVLLWRAGSTPTGVPWAVGLSITAAVLHALVMAAGLVSLRML
jgi:1,4-dihydroxy-2-naphthoate octaprenyltransferase